MDSKKIQTTIGEDKLKELINFLLLELSKIDVPIKRGNFIEFRTGMINVSPCGRSVTQEERDQFVKYDKENKIREKLVQKLQEKFGNNIFKFSIGGQISIDVFPISWDKTFCLQYVDNHFDNQFDEIHFFGDNVDEGKNDYEIFVDPRTIGHAVKDPNDTMYQARLYWLNK